MTKIIRTIDIEAPVEKVFEKCDDPNAFPQYVPNVSSVTNVQLTDKRIGDKFRVTYKIMGGYMNQDMTYVEYEPNRRIKQQVDGAVKGNMSIILEPQGSSTKATYEAELEISGGFLKRTMGKLVLDRTFGKDSEQMLENMKKLCEAGISAIGGTAPGTSAKS